MSLNTKFLMLFLLLLLAPSSALSFDPLFDTRIDYDIGSYPTSVFCADLDGDGHSDLVAALNSGSYPDYIGSVSILKNSGDGTFQPKADYSVGSNPQSVFCADLDGDEHLDLAVANAGSNTVSILKGNGDGTFQSKTDNSVGSYPQSVFCADFDGDGHLDLAVANCGYYTGSYSVSILKNNGDGTFQAAVNYTVGDAPWSVFCADLDGDGHLDLAVANSSSNTVSILRGNGDGTFQPKVDYAAGTGPKSVFCVDLDGDADLDLAVAGGGWPGVVSILKNNGDASFQAPVNYSAGNMPNSVFCADLDADGDFDLVVGNGGWLDNVSVLKNNGDGTFQPKADYGAGNWICAVFCADIDGDGRQDIAVANNYSDNVSILINKGNGIYPTKVDYTAGDGPSSVFSADLDEDGDQDLAVTNWYSNNVTILKNNGDRTFQPPVSYSAGNSPDYVFCADLDGDGDLDLAVNNANSRNVAILKNNGDGTFQTKIDYPVPARPNSVFCADLDGDGDLDLIVPTYDNGGIYIFKNNGDGTFQDAVNYSVKVLGGENDVAWADLDGDGDLDLAVNSGELNGDAVSILKNNGDGTFQPKVDYETGPGSFSVFCADLDGDGDMDLAVLSNGYGPGSMGSVSIFKNNGDGTFQKEGEYPTGGSSWTVFGADFDGDEDIDLAFPNSSSTTVSVLKNNGDGTFQPKVDYGVGFYPYSVVSADLDGDGDMDLAVPNATSDNVSILKNLTNIPAVGTIGGKVKDGNTQLNIQGILVTVLHNNMIKGSDFTNGSGNYNIPDLLPGTYDVKASNCAYQTEIRTGKELSAGQMIQVDFSMTNNFNSRVVTLEPDPNPIISTVMQGGTVHRYYRVVNSNNEPQAGVNVGIKFNSQIMSFRSNEEGIVDIALSADDLGSPDQTISATVTSLDGCPLGSPAQLAFEVMIEERKYEREFSIEGSFKGEGGAFLEIGGSDERSLAFKLEGTLDNPNRHSLERFTELTAELGVGVDIGVGLTINSFNYGAYAGAGVYGGIGGFKRAKYTFQYPDLTFDQSVAELLVILDPSTHVTMNPLFNQLYTHLLVNYTNIGQVLKDAYVQGDKGLDIFGVGEASITGSSAIFPTRNPLINFSLDASLSGESHFKWHIYENSLGELFSLPEGTGFETSGRVSASGSSDFSLELYPWILIGSLPKELEIWDDRFLFDGMLSQRIDFLYDGHGNYRVEIILSKRIQQEGQPQQIVTDRFWVDVPEESIIKTIMSSLPSTDNLYESIISGQSGPFNIVTNRNIFADILFEIFYKIAELQRNGLPSLKLNYQQEIGDYDKHDILNLQFHVGVLEVSGGIGAEAATRFGKNICTKKGVRFDNSIFLLETYQDDAYTSANADVLQVPQQLINNLGQGLLDLAYSSFSKIVEDGKATIINIGGSIVNLAEGAVQAGKTIGTVFWSWWGSSPMEMPASLSSKEFVARSNMKQRLQDYYNLSYGIGGFYSLTPDGLVLNAPSQLIIAYSDSEVVGIDENQLAMYYWNDSTSTWVFFGGTVDTVANTVTATIDKFRLYTLAPAMPGYKINLKPSPDTLLADNMSISQIISDTIRNNNGSSVEDSQLFTVGSDCGNILTADADTSLEGIQIKSHQGIISFELRAPAIACNARITARSVNGSAIGEKSVIFVDATPLSPPTNIVVICKDSTVTLKWQLGTELDLKGYKIYYDKDGSGPPYNGSSAQDISSPIDVGKYNTRAIYGLMPDTIYYFALTSCDISGNESSYSQEISIPVKPFRHGDANYDATLNVTDAVYLINYLFKSGPEPKPSKWAGDANCDGKVAVADVIHLINYLFKGGPPPCG